MPIASDRSSKAKIARRVIEVLDYFDDDHQEASVGDIVLRYGRPQSSTSELLASLVELGLLHRDPYSRTYKLTARAAVIGLGGQAPVWRDGRISKLLDQLVEKTGLSVALFGMVGLNSQILTWWPATRCPANVVGGLQSGLIEPLLVSASGWLLLSTIEHSRCERIIRQLNAEADHADRLGPQDWDERLRKCRDSGIVKGPSGFGSRGRIIATLLPPEITERPVALGLVYKGDVEVDVDRMGDVLRGAVSSLSLPMGRSHSTDESSILAA